MRRNTDGTEVTVLQKLIDLMVTILIWIAWLTLWYRAAQVATN